MFEKFVDPYVLPGTDVLRNKLGLRRQEELDRAERLFVVVRARGGVPTGDFDLRHLRAIHHYLFQDVYEWAGEIRTVNISKGSSAFQAFVFIETGIAHVHSSVRRAKYLRNLSPAAFAMEAAPVLSDLNYCHPFRVGNGERRSCIYDNSRSRQGIRFVRNDSEPRDGSPRRNRRWAETMHRLNERSSTR